MPIRWHFAQRTSGIVQTTSLFLVRLGLALLAVRHPKKHKKKQPRGAGVMRWRGCCLCNATHKQAQCAPRKWCARAVLYLILD